MLKPVPELYEWVPGAKQFSEKEFWNFSVVEEIRRSGFVEQLCKKRRALDDHCAPRTAALQPKEERMIHRRGTEYAWFDKLTTSGILHSRAS
jgi:hypothetical protein